MSPAVKGHEEEGSLSPGRRRRGGETGASRGGAPRLLTPARSQQPTELQPPTPVSITVTSQVLGIVQGNGMCKAELPVSNLDKGAAVQGCLETEPGYVSHYAPQRES